MEICVLKVGNFMKKIKQALNNVNTTQLKIYKDLIKKTNNYLLIELVS